MSYRGGSGVYHSGGFSHSGVYFRGGSGFRYPVYRFGFPSYRYGFWPYYGYPFSFGFGFGLGFGSWGYSPSAWGWGPSAWDWGPTVISTSPPASSPPVVVQQFITRPATPAAESAPSQPVPQSQPTENRPPLYLIAFKDSVIVAAVAYWAEGETLHYVTLRHEQKTTPLSKIDRDLTERLNRERKVPFHF
jgi:hypothetical protein